MVLSLNLCEEALVAKVPLLVARCWHPRARLVENLHQELSEWSRWWGRCEQCEGRRICDECGRGFNLADVNLPARPPAPAIVMPPMPAPAACTHKLVARADDAPKVVRRRLAHFHEQIAPLRGHFAARELLVDFEVLGGMEHTTPRLMDAILSHVVVAAAKAAPTRMMSKSGWNRTA
jgi:adenylate kinase family enzyme